MIGSNDDQDLHDQLIEFSWKVCIYKIISRFHAVFPHTITVSFYLFYFIPLFSICSSSFFSSRLVFHFPIFYFSSTFFFFSCQFSSASHQEVVSHIQHLGTSIFTTSLNTMLYLYISIRLNFVKSKPKCCIIALVTTYVFATFVYQWACRKHWCDWRPTQRRRCNKPVIVIIGERHQSISRHGSWQEGNQGYLSWYV